VNWGRVLHIIRKEFIQLRRDPQLLRIVIISPVFQLFIFGYAVTTDVRQVRTAVIDQDGTAESRRFTESFFRSGYFMQVAALDRPGEADHLLDSGRAQVVLWVPRGFSRDVARMRTAQVQVILDGSDSMTSGIIAGYAGGVLRDYAARVGEERLERIRHRVVRIPAVRERTRVWYNPELKSVNYMVPGVLSMILFLVTMLLTSLSIVKEREIGTMEQLVVTPIRGRELVVGKTLPYVIIGYLDMLLVLLVAVLWFRVPVQGSIPLLFALAGVFIVASLGLGLFISTVSHTQQQAMMVTFFFMLPSILLSGFIFPIENMPEGIRWLTYVIPLRYFLVVVRGIFLKGNGLEILWPQVAVLMAMGVLILGASSLRLRKRLS
jgi:ABC-2 type transport system permease protein